MANKQALIIGLGQFGSALARTLAQRGVDVIAVDKRPNLVQALSSVVAEAMAFDATEEDRLTQVAPARRDLCVCAIGPEARDSAIVVTALLRQMGGRRVIARASDDLTERIFKLIGAHEVINPERAYGERLASRLLYDGVLEQFPLGDDLMVTEMRPPPFFVGRTLRQLDLRKRTALSVVAIRRDVDGKGRAIVPSPDEIIRGDDILVVVGSPQAVDKLLESAS